MAGGVTGDSHSCEFWLFGYGSLIWKPPPHFDRRIPGHVRGYVRRFWQASEDHRGTPEAPGRVVTLISHDYWETLHDPHPDRSDEVWGVAYRIPPEHVEEVRDYLDLREVNGYTVDYCDFHPARISGRKTSCMRRGCANDGDVAEEEGDVQIIRTLVYIGTPENPQFTGPQEPDVLAKHIAKSRGPSGSNTEYLLNLETALLELSPESGDEHVQDLARRVREVMAAAAGGETDHANEQSTVDSVTKDIEGPERKLGFDDVSEHETIEHGTEETGEKESSTH